jgi:hypothetical protein
MTHTINEFSTRLTPQTHHFQHYTSVTKYLRKYINSELRRRGAVAYDLWLPETYYLPHLLHKDERIMGSVYGRYKGGRGALIATDQRVLFLDKKPLFLHFDELTYLIIGGVTYTRTSFISYVTLHTRLGDYKLRTFNSKNAANFVDFIETKCLQKNYYDKSFENVT